MPKVPVSGIRAANGEELSSVEKWIDPIPELDPDSEADIWDPLRQSYKHLDPSVPDKILGPNVRYDQNGFTFFNRRYVMDDGNDVDKILAHNCTKVLPPLRLGDIIRYKNAAGQTLHTGRVWTVDSTGNCKDVRSKFGVMSECVHPVATIPDPDKYKGGTTDFFRQTIPLQGIGDLWIRDAEDDNGEQYSNSLWASPDILVDAPPFDGSPDVNPAFGVVNRVSTVVHNRGNVPVSARVRYYWADPHTGLPPSSWQLIPGTTGHPNPTDPFTVGGNSNNRAPYVEWIPLPVSGVADPAHQCLLAIAYVNDVAIDPSPNSDSVTYPFDIRWDNNIAVRNVHVVSLQTGGMVKLQIGVGTPFDGAKEVIADIGVHLDFVPRLPIFGFPSHVTVPQVQVALGEREAVILTPEKRMGLFEKIEHLVEGVRIDLESYKESDKNVSHAMKPDGKVRTVAQRQLGQIPLVPGKPLPLKLEIVAPDDAKPGDNFYLRIKQQVEGEVTGCYTVVITIVQDRAPEASERKY